MYTVGQNPNDHPLQQLHVAPEFPNNATANKVRLWIAKGQLRGRNLTFDLQSFGANIAVWRQVYGKLACFERWLLGNGIAGKIWFAVSGGLWPMSWRPH